ncbi:hypothetical protein GF323_00980 [Candidatus Woesearchaeota archaeon]|nr:hypothetical protein [Candidatus Woesearchaeota archaeon]
MRYIKKPCYTIFEVIRMIDLRKETIADLFFKQTRDLTLRGGTDGRAAL